MSLTGLSASKKRRTARGLRASLVLCVSVTALIREELCSLCLTGQIAKMNFVALRRYSGYTGLMGLVRGSGGLHSLTGLREEERH